MSSACITRVVAAAVLLMAAVAAQARPQGHVLGHRQRRLDGIQMADIVQPRGVRLVGRSFLAKPLQIPELLSLLAEVRAAVEGGGLGRPD